MEDIDHDSWARVMLEFLVNRLRQYEGGEKYITYGELANTIDYPLPYTGHLFSSNIGKTLASLGHQLENIRVEGRTPPQIVAMLVNQNKHLPSDGIKEFIPDYPALSDEKKRDRAEIIYEDIFEFGSRWEEVLRQLGIELNPTANVTEPHTLRLYNPYGSDGSPEHIALKEFIKARPDILGYPDIGTGITEYPLKSGDMVDVVFANTGKRILLGVEIKSRRSGLEDLRRGIYQCIKYQSVMDAENTIETKYTEVKCILVIEESLPMELLKEKDKLGVIVFQRITPN